jgi:DNA-binding NarL/FixJ family response regulator
VLLERAPDVEMVGEASDGKEALTLIEALRPDVAVLDCEMPGLAGVEAAQEIRRRGWPTRVLALSAYDSERYVRGMLEAGAVGYLLKDEAPGVIVEAVRGAARGQGYFSPAVAAKVAAWARGERPGGLTEREMEVLRLVAEGLSNKEIAQSLGVTARTVDFHIGNILRKLEVASRLEAAVWAREQGIVP